MFSATTVKKFLVTLLCLTTVVPSHSYQYSSYIFGSSSPKQSIKEAASVRYNVGYKPLKKSGTTKVKKAYSVAEYQNLFSPDPSPSRSAYNAEFSSFDDSYASSTPLPGNSWNPYLNTPATAQLMPNKAFEQSPAPFPPSASNKIFHHDDEHHEQPLHFVKHVGHYITDAAGHKLKHIGEALESGKLTKPIIQKLSLAKVALIQLVSLISSMSAIKAIHVVAKASDAKHKAHHGDDHHVDHFPPIIAPIIGRLSHHSPHYPHTLVGLILNFIAQLSRFNLDAKKNLIPNLLKISTHATSKAKHISAYNSHV